MTILGHKITNIQMVIQICICCTYKYLLWCLESKIWVLRFQMCDLRIFGLFVAFLVFMALKVKLKTLAEFSKLFDHIMAKKYIKNLFFTVWYLKWPSKIFLAFFIFSGGRHFVDIIGVISWTKGVTSRGHFWWHFVDIFWVPFHGHFLGEFLWTFIKQ